MNLALRYRPRSFDEVTGQEPVTRTLRNALSRGGDALGHAFLFTGPRGVGKTTMARLLAMGLNCSVSPGAAPCGECRTCKDVHESRSLDVIEIDGATNNGVDEIRNLKEHTRYLPTASAHKVYIIDEVHMLSDAAFNALLKTLEEPPDYLVFIFATTEPHKIPKTVLSRVQRYDFRPLTADEIGARLAVVAEAEGINVEPEALRIIADAAEGSVRDALMMLEQGRSYSDGKIEAAGVRKLFGVVDREFFDRLSELVGSKDVARILAETDALFERGYTPEDFLRGFQRYLDGNMRAGGGRFNRYELLNLLGTALKMEQDLRAKPLSPRVIVDTWLMRLAFAPSAADLEHYLTTSGISSFGATRAGDEERPEETEGEDADPFAPFGLEPA